MWDSPASGSRQSAGRDVRPGPQPDDSVRFKRDRCAGAIADVFKSIADDEALPTSEKLRLMNECLNDANAYLQRAS
jgi:hypothetical protein